MSNVRKETLSGVKWQFLSKMTLQPVTFIFGMILARLITPEEMGIIGLTSIFFAIANQIKDCGFGTALLRKQDRTEADINTVFWFNVGMSVVGCVALCLAAPWFADFFDTPALVELTYVSALMLLLNSTVMVHWTLYSARRDFKTTAIVSTIATIVPMPFTVWAAFAGWSYWAMVFQGVASGLLSLIVIWTISPWKPRFEFSRESFKEFFGFGSKMLATGLVNISYGESRNLIIGKFYSAADLAYFHRAFKLCALPVNFIQNIVSSVSFPILAAIQDDEEKLFLTYRKYFRVTMLVVLSSMLTLGINAPSVIYTLYGEAWLACVPLMMILTLGSLNIPTVSLMNNIILVKGRADIIMRLELVVRIVGISLLVAAAFHSVEAICIAGIATGTFHIACCIYAIAREGWVSYRTQLGDILPYVIVSVLANVPSIVLNQFFAPSYWMFVVGLSSSVLLFIILMQCKYDETWVLLLDILGEKKLLKYMPFIKKRAVKRD